MPLAALLCLCPLASLLASRAGRRSVAALVVFSALFHLPAAAMRSHFWSSADDVNANPARLWSWAEPPFLHPLRLRPTRS